MLLTVHHSAMKARVAATRQIKSHLVTAPEPIRARWASLDGGTLINTPATGPGHSRRDRRHQGLTGEIAELTHPHHHHSPALIATKGYQVVTAATLLVTAGDNPDRLRSKQPSPRSAAQSPSPSARERPTGTASTAAATGNPSGHCTRWL